MAKIQPTAQQENTMKNNWFLTPKKREGADIRLICLPYAGGSASIYSSWVKTLPENIELTALQLPGRANRMTEPLLNSMEGLIEDLAEAIEPLLDKPYALFGHSMGARIGFELMHKLKEKKQRLPQHFIASGSRAPHLPSNKPNIHLLPDDEFTESIKQLEGTPKAILNNQEFMGLYRPILRADFCIANETLLKRQNLLTPPVSVFHGTEDSDIDIDASLAWGEHFSTKIMLHKYNDGHFFIETQRDKVLDTLTHILEKTVASNCENYASGY